jgi:RpiR family carbohydrate utilization transcriptional regulator
MAEDLLSRIQSRYGKLRKSERLVADYLREKAGQRLEFSITEFADTLGVSEATISRFTRAIGYRGYADMKLSVAAASTQGERFANIPVEITEQDSLLSISSKLANALATSLMETQKLLNLENVERAVAVIRSADKVVLIGVGGSASVCDEAAHLFLKAGIDAISYRDGYTQTIVASGITERSVMVGVSHTGSTETIANALTLARKNGAPTIAITSDPNSIVGKAAENTLVTWHHTSPQIPLYGDFLEGRLCQLYLVDLLYLRLLFELGDVAEHRLRETTEALEKYYRRSEI